MPPLAKHSPAQPPSPVGVIACAAIARELTAIARYSGIENAFKLHCLPAELHNTPQLITGRIREKLDELSDQYEQLFVAYADCGTGGQLDSLLEERGVTRLPGAHCYEFFAGNQDFEALMEQELGTFFLTDFLVRHFKRLFVASLGLDRYPQLKEQYFAHYKRLVYLAQTDDQELRQQAEEQAAWLGLEFEYRFTGYDHLHKALDDKRVLQWQN
ncbi:DUF1638 domain-containing protein [Porticoccus sp. W117]|uniref:DUF1638 domain-containing protein n=1 Tax=Porticoccus sp. W117 TaxID=3054777 RepID=UPI0025950D23|nr:DUF1638 domain-containing protein [Porticoccus sp. W117]MDM3871392.1 DUF1638 domain-containing protein [Porticoccus sp. W117]